MCNATRGPCMHQHATPALDRARRFLREQLRLCRRADRQRLASARTMADACDVSHVTMLKAVRELVSRGVLRSSPGRGIELVTRRLRGKRAAPPSRAKWPYVAEMIASDIVQGTFPAGERLPLPKQLAYHYGVSPPTLRQALRHLVWRNVLRPERRTHRVVDMHRRSGANTMVLITRGDRQMVPAMTTPRTRASLYELERECVRRGLVLDVVLCDYSTGRLYSLYGDRCILDDPHRLGSALGFLVWPVSIMPEHQDTIRRRVRRTGLPVSVMLELDTDERRSAWPLDRLTHLLKPALGRTAGVHAAQYLYSLGHRRVAFISHISGTRWSSERLAGLREVFGADGVIDCTPPVPVSSPPPPFPSAIEEAVSTALESAGRAAGIGEELLTRTADSMRWETLRMERHHRDAGLLRPCFEQALMGDDISAWVCINDAAALEALSFLRVRGCGVPRDLSVVGFDNSEEAHYRTLTSYDFNARGLAQAMVGQVLRWVGLPPQRPRAALEVPGMVVPRGSTAAPRGA
ncbi:MAG: GntR family transcriptional regulator [Chitinivibrionales bacterium]|nr:GntR family transcriptional regulator [Chitinivibrionales bacterium]